MSKEAVKREMSRADRVKAERAKERAQKEREEKEADQAQRGSFTRLLGEMGQRKTKQDNRSVVKDEPWEDEIMPGNGKSQTETKATKAGTQTDRQQAKRTDGRSINMMWAEYLDAKDREMDELRGQVAKLQGIVQKLEEFAMSHSEASKTTRVDINQLFKFVKQQDEKIAGLEKEQEAAAKVMEALVDELDG